MRASSLLSMGCSGVRARDVITFRAVRHFDGIGKALALLMQEARIDNKTEIARRGKIPGSAVTRAISGETVPTIPTLDGFLAALGKTPHDLARALDEVAGRAPVHEPAPVAPRPSTPPMLELLIAAEIARQLAEHPAVPPKTKPPSAGEAPRRSRPRRRARGGR